MHFSKDSESKPLFSIQKFGLGLSSLFKRILKKTIWLLAVVFNTVFHLNMGQVSRVEPDDCVLIDANAKFRLLLQKIG